MARHEFEASSFFNAIGAGSPVLEVADGDTIVTRTLDAWGIDGMGVKRADRPNPMTGPFFVRGAGPGDTLEMQIKRMTPNRDTGWTFGPVAAHVIDPHAVQALPARDRLIWRLDHTLHVARLEAPPPSLTKFAVPFAPMLGCFGVAPALGQAISTATSGPYGGNMDYRRFGPGTTAYFPVSVEGALLYLGDGHYAQGDGEIVGTGIETSFEIEFTVHVHKGRTITWPRGETEAEIFTVGNARPLDQALQHATTEMLAWLVTEYRLDAMSASHVMGQCVRYDVANVFNPAFSIACRIAKSALVGLR